MRIKREGERGEMPTGRRKVARNNDTGRSRKGRRQIKRVVELDREK